MGGSRLKEINSDNFATEVMSGPGIKIVKFWAEWCGPCKSMAPIVDDLAVFYSDHKIVFYSADVDDAKCAEVAAQYNVSAIPTMIAFRDGKHLDTRVGGGTKSQIKEWIDGLLGSN